MAGLGVALCCMVALEYYAVEGRFRASQCQAGCPLSPPCMADCWFFCFVLFCFVFFFLIFVNRYGSKQSFRKRYLYDSLSFVCIFKPLIMNGRT